MPPSDLPQGEQTTAELTAYRPRQAPYPGTGTDRLPVHRSRQPAHPGTDSGALPLYRQDHPEPPRRHITGPQRIGAVLLAAVCVLGAAWYVPRILSADSRAFTGTVISDGTVSLNFSHTGQVAKILVTPGQSVRAGQVLAIESIPAADAAVAAAQAAVRLDQHTVARLTRASGATRRRELATARTELAKAEARLAADQVKMVGTEIVAPSGGAVVEVNGRPGQAVSPSGIHYDAGQSQASGSAQTPTFSLLPDGPKTNVQANGVPGALPVISLRVSDAWQVSVLVPQDSISQIKQGEKAQITVPAAHVAGVTGRVAELLSAPVSTSGGVAYQAIIAVTGGQRNPPLSGMTADVEIP